MVDDVASHDQALRGRASAWRDADPDPATRAEVAALLAADDLDGLRDRFDASLAFGTAGLRGALGAGPNRMNRAVVIRTTAGLAAYLAAQGWTGRPVVVGYDARHCSADFAADAAGVLAAAGFAVHLADRPVPTPVLAFGVLHLGACAGVQVTASHNPPTDNGYKVYLDDGAQIVPPADVEIAAAITQVGRPDEVPGVPPTAGLVRWEVTEPGRGGAVTPVGDGLIGAYVAAVEALVPRGGPRDVSIVYTPLHGVGRDVVRSALAAAGFAQVSEVEAQADPDPDFPTVAFPNPEEPGALDLALAQAHRVGADLVVANDPDADRLAVAVEDRPFTGDQLGVLLADWVLAHDVSRAPGGDGRVASPDGGDRLVVSSLVSSTMLAALAARRGVHHLEVLTGFKWIARAAFDRPDLRFVFGYEEALGYCIGTVVRDKDGIAAALAVAALVAELRAEGRTLWDRWDDLERELGVHVTGQRSVRFEGLDGLARMRAVVDALAVSPPPSLDGRPVTEVVDLRRGGPLPPTDAVVIRAEGRRLIVRPSGTEPKLKVYAEAIEPVGAADRSPDSQSADSLSTDSLSAARATAQAALRSLLATDLHT